MEERATVLGRLLERGLCLQTRLIVSKCSAAAENSVGRV